MITFALKSKDMRKMPLLPNSQKINSEEKQKNSEEQRRNKHIY